MEAKKTLPMVSVIIPVYNAENTISKCIERLLNQSYPGDLTEIIIVDNNSTDSTPDLITNYDVLVIDEKKQGPSAARNAGIRAADGDILIFTDADCLADKDFVKEHVSIHTREDTRKYQIVGGGIGGYNRNTWAVCDDYLNWHFCSPLLPPHEVDHFLPTANLSIDRKIVLKEEIFFDEDLFPGEDVAFCESFLRKGYKMYFHSGAVVTHINRDSFIGFFKHCNNWVRPELALRKKGFRIHKSQSVFSWILNYFGIFFNQFFTTVKNVLRTKRYKILFFWPLILMNLLIFNIKLFGIEMRYRQFIKECGKKPG